MSMSALRTWVCFFKYADLLPDSLMAQVLEGNRVMTNSYEALPYYSQVS